MTTDNDTTTSSTDTEPSTDDAPSLRQRARAEREFRRLRESDNPFAELAVRLRDEEGLEFTDIYDEYATIEEALGETAMAEEAFLIPEWRVAVRVPADTPSGYRFERHERVAETQDEAEELVERHTGREVVSKKTEQVGYTRVS